jgi:hypothetical protein
MPLKRHKATNGHRQTRTKSKFRQAAELGDQHVLDSVTVGNANQILLNDRSVVETRGRSPIRNIVLLFGVYFPK